MITPAGRLAVRAMTVIGYASTSILPQMLANLLIHRVVVGPALFRLPGAWCVAAFAGTGGVPTRRA